MKKKEAAAGKRLDNEQHLVKEAGQVGATMVHISWSAMKLFAGMVKVAFRASKLLVDTAVRISRDHR